MCKPAGFIAMTTTYGSQALQDTRATFICGGIQRVDFEDCGCVLTLGGVHVWKSGIFTGTTGLDWWHCNISCLFGWCR